MARDGFTKVEKNKMFLTYQTYDGLKTTGTDMSGFSFYFQLLLCQDSYFISSSVGSVVDYCFYIYDVYISFQ